MSLVLPVSFCYSAVINRVSPGGYMQGTLRQPDQQVLMVVLTPGIRWYPGGTTGTVRYALGGHLLLGFGKGDGSRSSSGRNDLQSRALGGCLLTNSLHIQAGRHIRMGIEIGLGIGADDGLNSVAGAGLNPLGQAGVFIGGRW